MNKGAAKQRLWRLRIKFIAATCHCKIATAIIIRKSILYHTNWWKLQKWVNSLGVSPIYVI